MRRSVFALAFLGAALVCTAAWTYAQTPPPNVYRSLEAGKPTHAVGDIHGLIVSVDYPSGLLMLQVAGRRRTVAVVPSTTIYRRGQYATFSDLRPGERVSISAYEVSGRLVAQTIRI
jgi:hypothetical protein